MRRLPVYLFVIVLIALAFSRCAQIVAPTGGPKDTLPPYLVNATPPDSSLHFKSKKIVLDFDEFIQLQDLQKQLIIAPNPKRQPQIRSKLRTLTISWENDTLKPNTTYTINMGNAIEDIDEGNPLKGFRYVFSTGDYLDSLEIGGEIRDARTGMPDSTMAVMLYYDLTDSVVTKEKPVYYARTTGDGSFLFRNLPHGTFKLFALKDANGDLQYNDSTEAIAFIAAPLKLDSNIRGINLFDFLEKENVPAAAKAAPAAAPSKEKGKPKVKKLTVHVQLNNGEQDLNKPLLLGFDAPLKSVDSTGITLQEDSAYHPVTFGFTEDTSRKAVRLSYHWKEHTPYRLILDSAFARDTSGVALSKTDTLKFSTKSLSDYGTLTLHFDTKDTAHYVVQLFQNDEMLQSAPLGDGSWKTDYLNPGDYQIRVLKDDNRNGRWDRGCYFCKEKRQPEEVYSLKQKFTVKANWDNDFPNLKFNFEPQGLPLRQHSLKTDSLSTRTLSTDSLSTVKPGK